MNNKIISVLSNTALFNNIDNHEIESMLMCFSPKLANYSKSQYIVSEGQNFESIGILIKGKAIVTKENAAGIRQIVSPLSEGDIFGEMLAFSKNKTWLVNVQAQVKCEVLFLKVSKIIGNCQALCPWHKTFIQNFMTIISEKALMLNRRLEYMTIKNMRAKICTYLLEQLNNSYTSNNTYNNISIPLNRNELADYLNVSRASLSREICNLKKEGIIDFYLNCFKILDIEALKKISRSVLRMNEKYILQQSQK